MISIDPGSNTMGVVYSEIDLANKHCHIQNAQTVSGFQLMTRYPRLAEVYGERAARLYAHKEFLVQLFRNVQPHGVITEAPFMGRFPQAYAALIECVAMIRQAVMEYDDNVFLDQVDPPTAKIAVGVSGRGSNKEEVGLAVQRLKNVSFAEGLDYSQFDEHTSDAIAVGYYKFLKLVGGVV